MIKNIIFDFGGVLVGLDKHRCMDAFARLGARAIAGYVDECRQEDLFHELEVGAIGIAEFAKRCARRVPDARRLTPKSAAHGAPCSPEYLW